jgi:hypothetical protein
VDTLPPALPQTGHPAEHAACAAVPRVATTPRDKIPGPNIAWSCTGTSILSF